MQCNQMQCYLFLFYLNYRQKIIVLTSIYSIVVFPKVQRNISNRKQVKSSLYQEKFRFVLLQSKFIKFIFKILFIVLHLLFCHYSFSFFAFS